jgi:hypothetical protein
MNNNKRLETLKSMVGNAVSTEEISALTVYLSLAEEAVLNRLYPFGCREDKNIPSKYDYKVCEIACYLFNKRGAEGQTAHGENGISRSYESAGIPDSMLKDIVPFVGVIK